MKAKMKNNEKSTYPELNVCHVWCRYEEVYRNPKSLISRFWKASNFSRKRCWCMSSSLAVGSYYLMNIHKYVVFSLETCQINIHMKGSNNS